VHDGAGVFAAVPPGVGRVGVFGQVTLTGVLEAVDALGLDAAQLHSGAPDEVVRALAERGVGVWHVARIADRMDVALVAQRAADASVVLAEARVPGRLGGTGVPLEPGLAAEVRAALPGGVRFALAGGLRPETVGEAVRAVGPDIVDVSSGVEVSVGVKDPTRIRDFVREALSAHGA
jgi:phosphoribosylanthranilate isomerase